MDFCAFGDIFQTLNLSTNSISSAMVMTATGYLHFIMWLFAFDIFTFLSHKILSLHPYFILSLGRFRGFYKSSLKVLLFTFDVKCFAAEKPVVLDAYITSVCCVYVGQSEAVTLTTHPCRPHRTSTTSGPMTESIWVLHLVYHKEKVLF